MINLLVLTVKVELYALLLLGIKLKECYKCRKPLPESKYMVCGIKGSLNGEQGNSIF